MRFLICLSCLALIACGDPKPATPPSGTEGAKAPDGSVVAELSGVWEKTGDTEGASVMVLADDGSLHWLDLDALQGQRWEAEDGLLTLRSVARQSGDEVVRAHDFQLSGDQLTLMAFSGEDEADEKSGQTWHRATQAAASISGDVRLPDGHPLPSQAVLALGLEKTSSESGVDGALQRRVIPAASAVADGNATTMRYRLYYDPTAVEDGDILHLQASIIVDGIRYYGTRKPAPPPTPADSDFILELAPMGPGHANGTTAP